jgi:hypothetical protein
LVTKKLEPLLQLRLRFADCSNEVRLPADVSTELDDFPAARPFGSDAWTEAPDDDDDEKKRLLV